MDETSRLRVASRIHFILLRHLGTGIDIGTMLNREHYAREVLYVCDGSEDSELRALARQFREARRALPEPTPEVTAPRRARVVAASSPVPEPAWGADTSGFGYDLNAAPADVAPPVKGWFNPSRWLSRPGSAR